MVFSCIIEPRKKGMKESVKLSIENAISSAPAMYSRLILLVGPPGSGKTHILQEISAEFGRNILNVNLEISKALLELPIQRRQSRIQRIFGDIIRDFLGGEDPQTAIILLDNLEILFDKDLKQDPLILLQGFSRNLTIIASWNGSWAHKRLTFAKSGHPEYRFYDKIDAQIIELMKEDGV
jgi:Cdc6-like AAA superfamily ATPase